METVRHIINLVDLNSCITPHIWINMLEAWLMQQSTFYTESLDMSIDALSNFTDKNRPENSAVVIYWTQQQDNEGEWVAWPDNIQGVTEAGGSLKEVIKLFLELTGRGAIWNDFKNDITGDLVFNEITSDFDDSGLNLVLGGILAENQNTLGPAYNAWYSYNSNFSYFGYILSQYAYRPWSSDINENGIDPRSFYIIKEYLWQLEEQGRLCRWFEKIFKRSRMVEHQISRSSTLGSKALMNSVAIQMCTWNFK